VIENLDSKIRVSVINPGDPIPEEDRAIIWERYQRSQHHGGRNKGTGIGLSIVSTYLKAHDMLYGVDCEEGLTTFWFESSRSSDVCESE
jgi:signal transduction histidine kinase